MATISLCMIVKDEKEKLLRCLESVKSIVDEIIITDTGESGLEAIKEGFGAKVFHYKWSDDFSAARNFSISKAPSDWILIMDADEFFSESEAEALKRLVDLSKNFDVITLDVRNYSNNPHEVGFVPFSRRQEGYLGYFPIRMIRLFRNRKGYKYENPIHEGIENSVAEKGGKMLHAEIFMCHLGSPTGSEEERAKQLKYLEYSKKRLEINPKDVKACCDVALIYFKFLSDHENSKKYLKKALEIDAYSLRPYIILGELYVNTGKFEEAAILYKAALNIAPKNESLHYNLGQVCFALGRKEEAMHHYRQALAFGCVHREEISKKMAELENKGPSYSFSFSYG